MSRDPHLPTFFVYYCGVDGDILGKLMLTDQELIFEPLAEANKGLFHPESDNIMTNQKLGAIISFEDIMSTPEILKVEVNEDNCHVPGYDLHCEDDTEMRIKIKLWVSHIGNFQGANPKVQERLKEFRQSNTPLASVVFKINQNDLLYKVRTNEDKIEIANKIIDIIERSRSTNQVDNTRFGNTILPVYDINFEAILGVTKDHLNAVNLQLHTGSILELFGYNNMTDSLFELKNESILPIKQLFTQRDKFGAIIHEVVSPDLTLHNEQLLVADSNLITKKLRQLVW